MFSFSVYLVLVIVANAAAQGSPPPYRSDYVYRAEGSAYYKLHTAAERWQRAQQVCREEGAALLGGAGADLTVGHALMKRLPDTREAYISTEDEKANPLADETTEDEERDEDDDVCDYDCRRFTPGVRCNVLTLRGQVSSIPCYQSRPFICRVAPADLHYNQECKLYDPEFKLNATLGSCYKVRATPYSWGQAAASCQAEGSHLVVLNSAAETQFVQSQVRARRVLGASNREDYFWHVGFRSHPEAGDSGFKTIFNQTLAQAGYDVWSPGEPNNARDAEHCGSLFASTGKLNDVNCDNLHGFICEKEIPSTH